MITINYNTAYYLKSVSSILNLPREEMNIEIAFIGYVNSGKSSAINAVTNVKKLTKVSRVPGNTKYINLFEIKPGMRLVDFPGYGYSRNVKIKKEYWYNIIQKYLKRRRNLKGLILIMDVRHAIKYLDQKMIGYVLKLKIPMLVLLSKSDKISKDAQNIKLHVIQNKIKRMFLTSQCIQMEIFSSAKKYGIVSVRKKIDFWLIHK